MIAHESSIDGLVRRARGEYLEMPGLRLTLAQAARLWNLDHTTCRRVLHVLTHEHFLAQGDTDTYVRADSRERLRERTPDGRVRPDHRAVASDPSQS
jgi:hypothetical protein